MPRFKTEDLINALSEDVRRIKESAEFFKDVNKNKVSYCPAEGKWSVVQVLEHLNAYNRHYLPLIERELTITGRSPRPWFNTGMWGEKAVKMIKPKNVFDVKRKMRAMKNYTFPNSLNVDTVLNEFIEGQKKFLQLLDLARTHDLEEIKVPLTITRFVKFKMGDMFRFLIAHEQRHMIQARNAIQAVGIATDKFPVILQVVQQ